MNSVSSTFAVFISFLINDINVVIKCVTVFPYSRLTTTELDWQVLSWHQLTLKNYRATN